MKCTSVQRRLSAYLDRELPARARQAVEHHLSGCVTCRQYVQSLEADRTTLRADRIPEMPARVHARVMVELGRLAATGARRRAWARPLLAAAAVLLFLGGLGLGIALGRGPMASRGQQGAQRQSVDFEADDAGSYRRLLRECEEAHVAVCRSELVTGSRSERVGRSRSY
jgi:anti-sigma factor RsiW